MCSYTVGCLSLPQVGACEACRLGRSYYGSGAPPSIGGAKVLRVSAAMADDWASGKAAFKSLGFYWVRVGHGMCLQGLGLL